MQILWFGGSTWQLTLEEYKVLAQVVAKTKQMQSLRGVWAHGLYHVH